MSDDIGQFIAKVLSTLRENGYPDKKVALPLEKMYEKAAEKGYSFNKVLEFLKVKEGIDHEKTTEKVIFFPATDASTDDQDGSTNQDFTQGFDLDMAKSFLQGLDLDRLKDAGMGGMLLQAVSMLKNLTPEQVSEIQNKIASLSPEERREMMEKAKDMGLKF